jgi:hypothetical protein
LHVQANICKKNNIDKLNFGVIQLEELAKRYTRAKLVATIKRYITSKEHNNELLPCIYNERTNILEFDWSVKDFLEVVNPVLFPQ